MMKIQARMFIGMKIGGANNGIVDEANASKWIVISKDLHDSLTSKEKDEWKLLCALCIASEGGQKLDALADDETAFDEGEFDLLEEEEEEGAVPMSPGPMGRQRISSPITSSGSSTKHMFPHLHGTQTPLSYTSTRVSKHEYSASEADARRDSIRSNSSAGHGFRRSKTLSPEELAGMELDEQRTDIAQQSKLRRRQAEDQLRPPNEVLSHAHHHHHHHIRPDSVSSSGSRSEQSLCSGCGGLRDSGGQQVAPTPGPRSSSRANPTSVDKSPPLTPSRPKSSQNTTYDARGISSKPSKASRGSRDASKESRRGNSEGSNPSSSSHGVRSKIVTRTDYGAVDTDEQGERDAAFSEIDWANLSLNPPQVPEREHQHQHAAPQDVRRKK
ncbi:hypothetical protein DFH27DRAFT_655391 [Peziza echinospora]|nr:hypothetical protein DFH27DRAFT_655391 [Peziza echinospora]